MARVRGDRLEIRRMAKKFDGSGVVLIQCSEGVFQRLKLDAMPVPRDYGTWVNGRHYAYIDTRSMGADSQRYRVIWPEDSNGPGSKPKTSSFTLSGTHINETLYVLAEFLRDQGVDFVSLANKHGNGFKDVRLSGSELAYLTGDIPHSPACHVDFVVDDSPEVTGAAGGTVYDTPLDS